MQTKHLKLAEQLAILTATHASVGIFALWFPQSYAMWVNFAFFGFVVATLASVASNK